MVKKKMYNKWTKRKFFIPLIKLPAESSQLHSSIPQSGNEVGKSWVPLSAPLLFSSVFEALVCSCGFLRQMTDPCFVFWKRYGWIVCVNMMETFSFCLTLWLRTKCYLLNFCPCWCRSIICLVSFSSFSQFVLFDQNFFEVGLMNYFVNTFYYKFDSPRGIPFLYIFIWKRNTLPHNVTEFNHDSKHV